MRRIHVVNTLLDNLTYVVENGRRAVVVDPSEVGPVLRVLESLDLELAGILNTHGHFDHVAGNDELVKRTGCVLLDGRHRVDVADGSGDSLVSAIGLEFRVLKTPGHSEDSVSLYWPPSAASVGAVFTGDTLFVGGCGRLFTRSPEMMWRSLSRLMTLPADTEVYCGHDYSLENLEFAREIEPGNSEVRERLESIRRVVEAGGATVPSTIRMEMSTNPFLRVADPSLRRALGMEDAADVEVLAHVRRRKDHF